MFRKVIDKFRKLGGGTPAAEDLDFETEVAACLPVLELLEANISSAAVKGTTCIDDMSCEFSDMAVRAKQVVHHAETTSDALASARGDLQEVESCMYEIESVVRKARLVSLNGRIEAAVAGKHGKGFSVVAAETGELALQVTNISEQIRTVVVKLADTLRQASEQDLAAAKQSSDELASSISRSVVHLQFQDAVSQRLQHACSTLAEIQEHIGGRVLISDAAAVENRKQMWLSKLSSHYCVAEEHNVHVDPRRSAASETNSGVELF